MPTVVGMTDPLVPPVLQHWEQRVLAGQMTPGTAGRYVRVFHSFTRYVAASGSNLAAADVDLCRAFIAASMTGGTRPAAATSRFRLTVARDAYRGLLELGLVDADPTLDLRVDQPLQHRAPAPLIPLEATRLQAAGRLSPRDHLRPAAVELALAGGSHAEVSQVVVADLDLARDCVRLGGRRILLDPPAASVLRARVAACRRTARRRKEPWDPATVAVALSRPLATYPATSIAPSISSSLSRAMQAAGLTRSGLRPASIREYAANRCYALEGRVESVAELLGIASLDVAHGFIDHSWQRQYGEEVRARESG